LEESEGYHAFKTRLPEEIPPGDSPESPKRSRAGVFESGTALPYPHVSHYAIGRFGEGRFSHRGRDLIFSSINGFDPRTNGKTYSIVWPEPRAPGFAKVLSALLLCVLVIAGLAYRLYALLIAQAVAAAAVFVAQALGWSAGVFILVCLTLNVVFLLFLARGLVETFSRPEKRKRRRDLFTNGALAVGAVMFCVIILEGAITVIASFRPIISIPSEWERRSVSVPGATKAFLWHGKLHVEDAEMMRRSSPFPPKKDDVFRITVLGDSLTYGQGVAAEETYSKALEEELKKNYRVEVLNLGVCGYQSADALWVLREIVPPLKPDLVIYGACLNDFLPSGTGIYPVRKRYQIPLPEGFKNFMVDNCRSMKFVSKVYDKGLRVLKLRLDFYGHILEAIPKNEKRFAMDLASMNSYAEEQGYGSVIMMVLEQAPRYKSRGRDIAKLMEKHGEKAGMIVVPTEDYYRRYDNRPFFVSQWEHHPNEEAHKIFARFLLPYVERNPGLKAHRKAAQK
jgi:hypothetical protein